MTRALLVLPDPDSAPDRWTQRSLELRNHATISRVCPICHAKPRRLGVDYQEIGHDEFEHADGCRCSTAAIKKHLDHRGLEMPDERHVVVVVEYDGEVFA